MFLEMNISFLGNCSHRVFIVTASVSLRKWPIGEGLDACNRYFTGRMSCDKVQGTVDSNHGSNSL